MTPENKKSFPSSWEPLIESFLTGDPKAADNLCLLLQKPVKLATGSFLGFDSSMAQDVAQETIVAVLQYIRKENGFTGDLIRFSVTVARNRCRNILNWRSRHPHTDIQPLESWIEDPTQNPLDLLLASEKTQLLQKVIAALDHLCRDLLRSFFLLQISAEDLRQKMGLKTVQGFHYRKTICLEKAQHLLKDCLQCCSSEEGENNRTSVGTSQSYRERNYP